MANPHPKTDHIENFLFQPVGEVEGKLSRKPLQFVVEQDIHDAVMSLPRKQRITLLRKWVKEGVKSLQDTEFIKELQSPQSECKSSSTMPAKNPL